jgi:hypothetical protein
MLYYIHFLIQTASESWADVRDAIEQLLAGSIGEEALAEDDKFSQSQKLFWVINKIDSILPMIADAVTQWNWYLKSLHPVVGNPFIPKIEEVEVLIERLLSSQKGFESCGTELALSEME